MKSLNFIFYALLAIFLLSMLDSVILWSFVTVLSGLPIAGVVWDKLEYITPKKKRLGYKTLTVIVTTIYILLPLSIYAGHKYYEDVQYEDQHVLAQSIEVESNLVQLPFAPVFYDEAYMQNNLGVKPVKISKRIYGGLKKGMSRSRANKEAEKIKEKLKSFSVGNLYFKDIDVLFDEKVKAFGARLYFNNHKQFYTLSVSEEEAEEMKKNTRVEYLADFFTQKYGQPYFTDISDSNYYAIWMNEGNPVLIECKEMASFSKRVHVYFMDIHQMKRAFDLYYPDYLRSDYKIRMARADSIRRAQQDSIEAVRIRKAKEEEDRLRKKAVDDFMNL